MNQLWEPRKCMRQLTSFKFEITSKIQKLQRRSSKMLDISCQANRSIFILRINWSVFYREEFQSYYMIHINWWPIFTIALWVNNFNANFSEIKIENWLSGNHVHSFVSPHSNLDQLCKMILNFLSKEFSVHNNQRTHSEVLSES